MNLTGALVEWQPYKCSMVFWYVKYGFPSTKASRSSYLSGGKVDGTVGKWTNLMTGLGGCRSPEIMNHYLPPPMRCLEKHELGGAYSCLFCPPGNLRNQVQGLKWVLRTWWTTYSHSWFESRPSLRATQTQVRFFMPQSFELVQTIGNI